MTEPLLRTLDQIEGADLPLVGGKAFRLATLKQHGFNIPPGLVLTTTFFELQLKRNRLVPLWAGSPDVAVTTEALSWLASTLKTRPLEKELTRLLTTSLQETFSSEIQSFAVRSSAIDEDQRDHTFAGIHLTELGVPRSALPIAITRCWASALDEPAIKYRQAHGMSIQGIRIAVLIQPMLNPISSGVGFTINPITGSRNEMVIESTWGLGQTLVSGTVQPYFYRLSNQPPDYPIIEHHPGDASHATDPDQPEPLTPPALAELALQLDKIEALMGEAQDVEWARQDETLYFLQTRPVVLPPQPEQMIDQEWTRGNFPETLPELPSPLHGAILERSEEQAIHYFQELGFQLEGLGPYLKLILGRPYLNLTILKRIMGYIGANPGHVLHTIGYTEPGRQRNLMAIDWETAWRARRTYWLALKRILNAAHYVEGYQAIAEKMITDLTETDSQQPATLLGQLRQQENLYKEQMKTQLAVDSGISALIAIGSRLIAPLTETPAPLLSSLALHGLQTGEADLNQALRDLAELARQDEPTRQYFNTADPEFAQYEQAISTEFKQAFADLLDQFGHRAIYEADIGWPRYAEKPESLLRIIRPYVQHMPHSSDHLAAEVGLQAGGLNRLRQWAAKPVIGFLHRLLKLRDQLNRTRARAMAAGRRWHLALGEQWVRQGWLNQPDDIFWLTLEEIERTLMIEADMGITLSAIIQARKETYQTYAQTDMPFSLQESQIPLIQLGIGLESESSEGVIMGLPISPGQVRGTIMVLHSPDEFEKIADDIILVMPTTDPAWLPLLHMATGLIVEMGGLLSHGSVIAREYGVPAVANVPRATKRFQSGDCVLVDGSTGVIQMIEPSAPPPPDESDLCEDS